MQSDVSNFEIDSIKLIFECLKHQGHDILSDTRLSAEFSNDISKLIHIYVTKNSRPNLLLSLFQLFYEYAKRNIKLIDLSHKSSIDFAISPSVFWRFVLLNDFEFEPILSILNNQPIVYNDIELFFVEYLSYLLLWRDERCDVEIKKILKSIKQSPNHIDLCRLSVDKHQSNNNNNRNSLHRSIMIKSIPKFVTWLPEKRETDKCARCCTTLQSELCSELIYSIFSSFEFKTNKELNSISNSKFRSMWHLPELSDSVQFVNDIYGVVCDKTAIDNDSDNQHIIDYLFSYENQLLFDFLIKCYNLNMHHHLMEKSHNSSEKSDIISDYYLARSSIVLNMILSSVIDESLLSLVPTLKFGLNVETVKRFARKFLKTVTRKLKKDYEIIFTNKIIHVDFLIWCLKSKVWTKEIFLWYTDSSIFECSVEEQFLEQFCNLADMIADPTTSIRLAKRIGLINNMNLPTHRHIKLLKLFILNMSTEWKQQSLYGLSHLQSNEPFCSSVTFKASLRKSCNQLSGDPENSDEIELNLEYLLMVDPVAVMVELLRNALLKPGSQETVLKILVKFHYALTGSATGSQSIVVKILDKLLFHTEDNQIFTLTENDFLEKIKITFDKFFGLVKDRSIADTIFNDLLIPNLTIEDIRYNPVFAVVVLVLKQRHLQNEEFLNKATAILMTIAHVHLKCYLSGKYDCDAVIYMEMSVQNLMTEFDAYINAEFALNVLDSYPFSTTKLLFLQLYKKQNKCLVLPEAICQFLSHSVIEKSHIYLPLKSSTLRDKRLIEDSDITNDFAVMMILCSGSVELLDMGIKSLATPSQKDCGWKLLCRTHVVFVLFKLIARTSVDRWLHMLTFLQKVIETGTVQWFYSSQSSLFPLNGLNKYSSNLLLLSILQCLFDLGSVVQDQLFVSKLVKFVVNSLPLLIPRDLCESKYGSHFYVKFEVLLHLLKMCQFLEFKGDYGLKSVLLFAQPLLMKLDDEAESLPGEMQQQLNKLAGFEKFLM